LHSTDDVISPERSTTAELMSKYDQGTARWVQGKALRVDIEGCGDCGILEKNPSRDEDKDRTARHDWAVSRRPGFSHVRVLVVGGVLRHACNRLKVGTRTARHAV
jgi:hypothetical protein